MIVKLGSSLEDDVQRVYSSLLNMRDEGVVVASRVRMAGKSGAQHEVDVYYEFRRAGVRHRVAIECKDWSKAISKGQVQEFESKIRDIGDVTGVIVSRNGYQDGAVEFAHFNDIMALSFDDLPTFMQILGDRLQAVALPQEDYIGEPFWVIMEIRDGRVTGSHYGIADSKSGVSVIPLTFCKVHAERIFREARLDHNRWAVRGLPRFALRAFLITLELYEKKMRARAAIFFVAPGSPPNAPLVCLPASREDLIREYYGEAIPSIEDGIRR